MIELKVKKLNDKAVLPVYANDGSNGLDMTATEVELGDNKFIVKTGISVEIPEGHVGLLFARSSIAHKQLSLANAVGVIDSNYRGEISFVFRYVGPQVVFWDKHGYNPGERVGQLLIIESPKVKVVESKDLSKTVRGTAGYGSTGK